MSVINQLPAIGAIGPSPAVGLEQTQRADRTDLGGTFQDVLKEARQLEHTSTDMAEKFANGDPAIGIHEVMIASEKANVSLRFATTLKNKALEAYRELMNTQV